MGTHVSYYKSQITPLFLLHGDFIIVNSVEWVDGLINLVPESWKALISDESLN